MTERRTDSAEASGAANSVFVEGLLHRGVASHRLGKIDEAKTFYERVLSYQRANFDALQLLALANSTQGNYASSAGILYRGSVLQSVKCKHPP